MAILTAELKHFLQSLTKNSIESWSNFESLIQRREIKKNDHFFHHFDHCNEVAIVSEGLFRIYLTNQEGEEKTYSFIPQNSFILDFFLAWEENSKTEVSVQALEDSVVYTFKYNKFVELMNTDPSMQEIYREVLLRNYFRKTKREIEFVQFNAKERLEKFITNKRIDFNKIPKSHLASYLGIQPPSLSRLLRELRTSEE